MTPTAHMSVAMDKSAYSMTSGAETERGQYKTMF